MSRQPVPAEQHEQRADGRVDSPCTPGQTRSALSRCGSTLRDETGDPWNGRSLEWATPSPPPAFNFAVLPNIQGEEAYWGMKERALQQARPIEEHAYADIEMPRNSPTGFICAFFATIMGFALIWHIWWMVGLAALGAYATFVVFAWRDKGRVHHSGGNSRAHRSSQPKRPQCGGRPTTGGAMTTIEAAAGRNDPNRTRPGVS